MQFFRKFSTDFVGRNIEKGQQGKNVMSSRVFRSVFQFSKWKCLKLTLKKIPNFSIFQRFYAILSPKLSTDFVDWNVETSQQGKICCPAGFSEDFLAVFLVKMSQKEFKNAKKTQNFPIFKLFMHFLLKFRRTSSIGRFSGVYEEKIDCPLDFRRVYCISLNENV